MNTSRLHEEYDLINNELLSSIHGDKELDEMLCKDALASHVFNRCLRDRSATRVSFFRELAIAQYAAKQDILGAYMSQIMMRPNPPVFTIKDN